MKKITCQFCLQPEAVRSVAGERSSQYTCHQCGEVFELDHPPREFKTQARPQSIALPAAGGMVSLRTERQVHAS